MINITVEAELGLPNSNFSNLQIYPNPVTNILTVSASESISEISVFNLLGQKLISKKNGSSQEKMDVSSFVNGFYLLQTTIGKTTKTTKFLKQ